MLSRRTFVFGNGGHARVIFDAMELLGIAVAAFIDETSDPAGVRPAEALSIVRTWRDAANRFGESLPVELAVGRSADRDRIATELLEAGVSLQTICHPGRPSRWLLPRRQRGRR